MKLTKRLSDVRVSEGPSKDCQLLKKYRPLHKLGEGKFAKVRLYQHLKTKKKYAVKKMNRRELRSHRFGVSKLTAADCVKEELRVLGQLQHPNLIWLHEIIDDPQN